METKLCNQFREFIAAYLSRCEGMLFVEVDKLGQIISYNNALSLLIGRNVNRNTENLRDYFIIKKISKTKLDGFECEMIELYLKSQSNVKLKGYLLEKAESSLYIAENEKIVTEELFEQMNEINLELSNLTREINKKNLGLKQKNKLITEMMYQDPLTKLNNRRYLYEQFKLLEVRYTYDELDEMILVLTDIDFFKSVNDNFGHDVGDAVLKEFSNQIRECTRDIDLKIRFGGDEFIIIFVNTSIEIVIERLETIRNKFKNMKIKNVNHKLTASFGVAEYIMYEGFESFVKRADDALYKVKENGRDDIVIWSK